MKHKYSLTIALFLLCVGGLTAWDGLNTDLEIELATVAKAGPPRLLHRTLLFTYDQRDYARFVGIAFDFENYQRIHPFKRNERGIFIFPLEVPEGTSSLTYRLVVDGLWIPDPFNDNKIQDRRGNLLSYLNVTLPEKRLTSSPIIDSDRHVKFVVKHAASQRVFVSGDFTNWEPFMIEMTEVSPGLYSYERSFPPGDYQYYYIVSGAKVLDPLNPRFGTDSHGYLASRFTVR